MKGDIPVHDGFKAEKKMVYAAKPSGSDEHQRITPVSHIVYGQTIPGQRHHKSSRTFHQHCIVALRKYLRGRTYLSEIHRPAVQFGSQMRRTRITVYLRHCQALHVFRKHSAPHYFPVQFYIFRHAGIARLDKFLRYCPYSPVVPESRQVTCRITFPDIGIYTADKIYFSFFHNSRFTSFTFRTRLPGIA